MSFHLLINVQLLININGRSRPSTSSPTTELSGLPPQALARYVTSDKPHCELKPNHHCVARIGTWCTPFTQWLCAVTEIGHIKSYCKKQKVITEPLQMMLSDITFFIGSKRYSLYDYYSLDVSVCHNFSIDLHRHLAVSN
jgi:hypothetical protein